VDHHPTEAEAVLAIRVIRLHRKPQIIRIRRPNRIPLSTNQNKLVSSLNSSVGIICLDYKY
jgi:hypothetical protein